MRHLTSSSFQALKRKKTQRKKNHREEKNAEKGRSFPSSSRSTFSLLALAFAFLLLPFCFKHFLLAFFSSQAEENKKTQRKKIHRKEKKMQRREGAYFQAFALPFHFWLLFLPSYFCIFVSSAFSLASFSSQVEENKKKHRKKNAGKGGNLPFFFHFCIWDEMLFLLFPLHIPSTLSSPPSSSLVFHISSKFYATQVQELS